MKYAFPIGLMIVVIVYTVLNYVSGKIPTTNFLVYMAILVLPLVNTLRLLYRQWRENR